MKVPSLKIPALSKGQLYTIAIMAVVLIVVIVLVCVNYSKIKSWIQDKKEENELAKDIDTSNVSISSSMMRQYADRLYTAMKGIGTDEDTIYDVFGNFSTTDEVLQLIKVFGTRDDMTLPQWIVDELTTKERKKLNTILTNKGVTYQF
jgi:hypothetical protein